MKRKKGFTLIEVLVVSTIISIVAACAIVGYNYYARQSVIAVLSSAVMTNVQIIEAYYATHNEWVTDVIAGNDNLTTNEELKMFGLSQRDLSSEFMIRVFKKEGFPHIIATEQIGLNKYNISVSYHFKTHKLVIGNKIE